MTRKQILAIDGGGIRGIIPLCALVELEAQLRKPAREVFSFVAGTSTGAIICAGLARGISAAEILTIYRELGRDVFKLDLFGFVGSLGSYKYRSQPLYERLRQRLGDVALNELPVDIMLTSMRVRDGRPFYFVKDNPGNSRTTGKLRLADCVTASSAAPTYFDPWNVPGVGACIDGGVTIAGNPCYQACVEAFDYSNGAYLPANTSVVSLGTGFYPDRSIPGNLIDWIRFVIGQLLEEPAEQQVQLLQRHYAPQGTHVFRWNPQMPRAIGMDDAGAIDSLIAIGQAAATGLDWVKIIAGDDVSARTLARKLPRNQMP